MSDSNTVFPPENMQEIETCYVTSPSLNDGEILIFPKVFTREKAEEVVKNWSATAEKGIRESYYGKTPTYDYYCVEEGPALSSLPPAPPSASSKGIT